MDYPSNSKNKRETAPIPEPRDIQPIITGKVVRKKQSRMRRFKETFILGDFRSVAGQVAYDILVPAVKDIVLDALESTASRMFYGDRGGSRRGRSSSSSPGRINYSSYSKPSSSRYGGRDEPKYELSRSARSQHSFDEIVLETRAEAEVILERLDDCIKQYQVVKVSEMYDFLGITSEFTDEKYGWYDLRDARVDRVRGGYYLNMPKPEVLRD